MVTEFYILWKLVRGREKGDVCSDEVGEFGDWDLGIIVLFIFYILFF